MCVTVCVCMHAWWGGCVSVCEREGGCYYVCVCVYVCMHVCECVYMYMHIYTIDQLSIPYFNLNNGIFVYSYDRFLMTYLISMTDRCLGRAEGEQKLPRSAGTPSKEESPSPLNLNLNLNPPSSSLPSPPTMFPCLLSWFLYSSSFLHTATSL